MTHNKITNMKTENMQIKYNSEYYQKSIILQ